MPGCAYFAIADPAIHVWVSNGHRGKQGVLYFKCQAYSGSTSRYATPLCWLKTLLVNIIMVMTALSEGVDLSAASRIFSHHPYTLVNIATAPNHGCQTGALSLGGTGFASTACAERNLAKLFSGYFPMSVSGKTGKTAAQTADSPSEFGRNSPSWPRIYLIWAFLICASFPTTHY